MTLKRIKVTGIILSGGQSNRMGKDKGLCMLNDKPLISYAIETLGAISNGLLIGANDRLYESFGFPVIADEISGIGPIGGIYSCLKASQTDDNFVVSCDMPLISEALVYYILDQREDYDVVIPMFSGLPEPMCGYYNKRIVPLLEKKINNGIYKIQDAIKEMKTKYISIYPELDFYHPRLFTNINTQIDLDRMLRSIDNKSKE